METDLPAEVRTSSGLYTALEWIESRHRLGIDLGAIDVYRGVDDRAKLAHFLRGRATIRSFLQGIKDSESDYRAALTSVELSPRGPAPRVASRLPDRDARFAAFGRFLGRGSVGEVIHPTSLRQLHICMHKESKNNVLLCGPAGTGKTTLVDQYAALTNGGSEILALDMPRLIAGTKYRGELEQRLLTIFDRAMRERITLFVDESHVLGTMGGSEGSINVLDLMKPYLVRPDFRVIGASTEGEITALLRDAAFRRRFSVVEVHEPDRAALTRLFESRVVDSGLLSSFASYEGLVLDTLDRVLPGQRYPDKLTDFFEFAEAVFRASNVDVPGIPLLEEPDVSAVLEEYVRLAAVPERLLGQVRKGDKNGDDDDQQDHC